jgi:hypothetical protein
LTTQGNWGSSEKDPRTSSKITTDYRRCSRPLCSSQATDGPKKSRRASAQRDCPGRRRGKLVPSGLNSVLTQPAGPAARSTPEGVY